MAEGRGGIGAIEGDLREFPMNEPEQQARLDGHLAALLEGNRRQFAEYGERIAGLEGQAARIEQMQGQMAQMEAACIQYRDAIRVSRDTMVVLQQRCDALARALTTNYRVKAAEIAAHCRQPAEPAARVLEMTKVLHDFFEPPSPPEADPDLRGSIPLRPGPDISKDN